MNRTSHVRKLAAAGITLVILMTAGAVPATANAADYEAKSTLTAADSVLVCDQETLNLNDQYGERLSAERIASAKAALNYMCDQRRTVHAMVTGKWVTNTTKSEVKTCGCGSKYKSWWVKVTATSLHTSGSKWVDVIWRIGPGGSGKWNSGPANFIGPTTPYANLPLFSGTMGLNNYVETVGTYTRNGKILEQIRGGA